MIREAQEGEPTVAIVRHFFRGGWSKTDWEEVGGGNPTKPDLLRKLRDDMIQSKQNVPQRP
jgi:hypothetical protein